MYVRTDAGKHRTRIRELMFIIIRKYYGIFNIRKHP